MDFDVLFPQRLIELWQEAIADRLVDDKGFAGIADADALCFGI